MKEPYLSIVVTSRNDNHGGDLLKRMTAFVNGLLHQSRKFSLDAELIIVEWNPPTDRPLLKDVLPKPKKEDVLCVRYITVPNEIHKQYFTGKSIPLFQMIAKNVGIRRARGKFVLCTNIDILFADECIVRLNRKNFEENVFYRTNRLDAEAGLLAFEKFDEQVSFAKNNVIKRIGKNETLKHVRSVPDFFYNFNYPMKVLDYFWGWYDKIRLGDFYQLAMLDTVACGDFTLMSREAWLKIDGYPELDLYSIHVDTIALYAAHLQGMKQHIFNYKECVYHIYHEEGWESIDDAIKMLNFMARKPSLDWWLVVKATLQMLKEGKTKYNLNKPDWGFADTKFEEHEFYPA